MEIGQEDLKCIASDDAAKSGTLHSVPTARNKGLLSIRSLTEVFPEAALLDQPAGENGLALRPHGTGQFDPPGDGREIIVTGIDASVDRLPLGLGHEISQQALEAIFVQQEGAAIEHGADGVYLPSLQPAQRILVVAVVAIGGRVRCHWGLSMMNRPLGHPSSLCGSFILIPAMNATPRWRQRSIMMSTGSSATS